MDQPTKDKWLNHDNKHHKENHPWNIPTDHPSWERQSDARDFYGNMSYDNNEDVV